MRRVKVIIPDKFQKKTLLRVDEAAEILALSRSSVYQLICKGSLRATRQRPLRIPLDALRQYLERDGFCVE